MKLGRLGLGFARTAEDWDVGLHLMAGQKVQHTDLISKANQAITVGVAASAGLTINSAVTLHATDVTEDTSITAQPDWPRNISAICNQASVGDGTFAAATGKWITVYGTDQFGNTIVEPIALNGTTRVYGTLCFATVTQIDYPSRNAASDTCTVTGGPALALLRPVEAAADLVEMGVKASAATAYTTTTLPATTAIGYAYGQLVGDDANDPITESTTIVRLTTADITGTFPSAPFVAEIISGSNREVVMVTATGTDGAYTELTIRRGLCGDDARVWGIGAKFQYIAPMSVSPTIVADHRFKFTYNTRAVF